MKDWGRRRPIFHLQSLIFILLLAGCRSTPEVTKIGLIAPFEGLERRSGYSALAAMRGALEDAGAADVAIVPLALDDGDDPTRAGRAMEKLLVDPAVVAVVGPLTPWAAAGANPTRNALPHWLLPFAVAPAEGFVDPRLSTAWASAWVEAVAAAVAERGQSRLVLAGWTPGWPSHSASEWASIAGLPVLVTDEPGDVASDDAVLWLGSAADGAAYLTALRRLQPAAPFWLGSPGAEPLLRELLPELTEVYWTSWTPIEYNLAIAPNFPDAPDAQLIYLATRSVLDRLTATSPQQTIRWRMRIIELSTTTSLSAPGE